MSGQSVREDCLPLPGMVKNMDTSFSKIVLKNMGYS
jgi:hypothetical protein